MSPFPFVDAHIHFWDLARLHYEWLSPPHSEEIARIATTYSVKDYLTESSRWSPSGAVHVEAGADASQTLEETHWVDGMTARTSLPNGLVAFAALDAADVAQTLAHHAKYSSVRGIRHMINWREDPRLSRTPSDLSGDPNWARGFGMLSRHGFSFDLQAYPEQFGKLARTLERHPETPVIVDHCGLGVDAGHAGTSLWRQGMQRLAKLPNVSVKVSGLGMAIRPWNPRRALDRARETIDIFGPERSMLASNFPTDRLFAPFDATMDVLSRATLSFSEVEQRALFGRTANRVYRLGLPI